MSFIEQLANRRSIYALGKNVELSESEISELIQKAIQLSPSAFNSQSSRAVILFNEFHTQFWNIIYKALEKLVPEDKIISTLKRMNSFSAGKGTVLFYEDQKVIRDLEEKYALYSENFKTWSEHSTAMAQLAVWTALSEKKIGASLQHYNPIADEEIAKAFDVPTHWKLCSQLVFGSIENLPSEKSITVDNTRFKVML
ncbi:nitroreductase family protein [Acinetobacter nectaris]|uniref:nitroreductase family protein n=1 Tax=Acinetobacter nectaris TaxID=1219382 RepID=UPI001F462C29|nr:nitroreductase family protein [Acinetobacter nectaris]MCF9000154.1 nitroreductase family protein [Acinetobacter nectaris]MCF9028525.1 nitroreductase family protein [Acinetobacter nectaris]